MVQQLITNDGGWVMDHFNDQSSNIDDFVQFSAIFAQIWPDLAW